MTKLQIALQALRDIADGMGKASPPDAMLALGRDGFHKAFCPLLQKVARDAIAKIEATGSVSE